MNTKNNNIPKRRFPDFKDEWVYFEFKSLLDSYEGIRRGPFGSALKKEFFVPTSEYVVYEQNNAIYNIWDTRYYINREKFQELEKFKVLPGDFLLSGAGTIGRISQVPKGVKQGVFNQALIRLRINKSFVDENFFLIWIQSDRMQEKLTDANPGSAMTNLVPMSELKKWIISIPKKEEQARISHFIFKINTLITLHQHKLDKLKNLKKSYLAELFPAEGERVPKRRFPGFEGEWEIRKLKELTEYRRGSFPQPYGKSEWYGGSGSMPFVQVVDVLSNLKLAETTKQQISKLAQNHSVFVPQGTVVITLQGSIGRVAITQYDSYVDRTLLIFEKFLFPTDIYYWALSMQQKFDIESKKAPGGTIKTITKEALSEFEIFLPTLDEQKQIGSFFQNLDKSITLQLQKLNKLNDLKKAYLNELFV